MYSVEWQKRGLHHAYILVWLIDKVCSEEIDSIIPVKIPNSSTNQLLFYIITINIICGQCGNLNRLSPCISGGKCTKSFPKNFTNDAITNVDEYPTYRRRNTNNGGQSLKKKIVVGA